MYSGYRLVRFPFAYGAFTLSGRLSQNLSARITESIMRSEPRCARTTGWPLSISLAATLEIDVSFSSSGYLDVSVPRVPFHTLWIGVWMTEVCSAGFPHSEISGSKDICSSPKLIAAYHVFLRLLVPRHPPCALIAWPFAHHPSVGDAVFWFSLLIFVCSHRLNRCLPILRFNVCIKDIWLNFNQIYMYAVFKVHDVSLLTEFLSIIRNLKYQISSI